MQTEGLPLDFSNLPLGSLYEERLVEDLLLLVDVVSACQQDDVERLAELGVAVPVHTETAANAATAQPA